MSQQTIKFSSIRKKLISGFLTIIIFTLLYFIISYLLVHKNKTLVNQAIHNQFNTSIFISKLAVDGQKLRRYEKEYFIYINNEAKRYKYMKEWSESQSSIQNRLEAAIEDKNNIWTRSDKNKLRNWLKSLSEYTNGFTNVVNEVSRSAVTNTIDANLAIRDGKNAFRVFLKGTSALGTEKFNSAKESATKINQNFNFIYIAMFLTSLLGFLVLMFVYRRVSNAVENPILKLTKSADEMSKGKIDQEIQQPNIMEFQTLYKSLERLRISQKTLIDKLMRK